MADLQEQVKKTISSNDVVVYSKSYCPYCNKTKRLLKELGVQFHLVELDQVDNGDELQDAVEAITGQRTVPNTFIGGKSVGGNSDVQALQADGKLVPLLTQVGAVKA